MKELSEIVAENLTSLRKSKKLTQQELADQIGYSDKSISKWELGKAIPSVDILKVFADFYGVTVDALITEGSAEEKVHSNAKNQNRSNQIVIASMAATFIFFVAAVIFANAVITKTNDDKAWIAFIWALPITCFVDGLLLRFFWGKCTPFFILLSIGVWTTILAFFLHFLLISSDHLNLWFIFLVAIPVQVMIILYSRLK